MLIFANKKAMFDVILNISLVLLFFTLSIFLIAVTFPTIRNFVGGKKNDDDENPDNIARRMAEMEGRIASLEQQLYASK